MPIHIVITGPESSGKTTLVKEILRNFDVEISHEYARVYLSRLQGVYKEDTIYKMAIVQDYLIQSSLANSKNKVCVSDTDLLTYKIWSEYKYGFFDPELQNKLNRLHPKLYVICKPDIPWVEDPLRENPNDRDVLFKLYLDEIDKMGVDYMIVEGEGVDRSRQVMDYIKKRVLE